MAPRTLRPRPSVSSPRASWPEEQLSRAERRLAQLRWLAHDLASKGRPAASVLRDIKLAETHVGLWQGRIASDEPDPYVVQLSDGTWANGPLTEHV